MLFVDSTDPAEIQQIFSWGVACGVTTNPLIFAREAGGADLEQRIREVLAVSRGHVSVELLAESEPAMIEEAERYHGWAPDRICIKVPIGEPGLRVTHLLRERGIATNVTCMMSFNQGYLAALSGATYASIFSGRVRDTGFDVRPAIRQLRAQIDREELAAKIIVGSIRHMMDVNEALGAGAHIVTVPPAIFRKMLRHPKSDEAIAEFGAAWRGRGGGRQ
ncbi:MAG: transaldolase [Deltaproteobacteria bacterium]|nr:transaldolase [Deltaproteobacteria bacterium]